MNDPLLPITDSFDRPQLDAPWQTVHSMNPLGSLRLEEGVLKIHTSAHSFAFAERPLPSGVALIQCAIALGTDHGASWGPGLAVVWSNRILRINVRRDGRFGFDDGSSSVFSGSIIRDGWNQIAVRICDEVVHLETSANGQLWNELHTFPRCRLNGAPLGLRIGKMGRHGKDEDHSTPGIYGICALTGLQILGQQTTTTWFQDPPEEQTPKKPNWRSIPKSCEQGPHTILISSRPTSPPWLSR